MMDNTVDESEQMCNTEEKYAYGVYGNARDMINAIQDERWDG